MQQRIAVLGGTGFIGRHLSEGWRERAAASKCLRLLVHRSRPDWLGSVHAEIVPVDLENGAGLNAGLCGVDQLVILMRPTGDGRLIKAMQTLLRAAKGSGVRSLVYGSSVDVYGPVRAPWVTESTPPQPKTRYECEHRAVEMLLETTDMPSYILRFGAVFGAHGRNLSWLANEMARGPSWKIAVRRSLYGRRRFHLIAVETVCEALAFFVERPPNDAGEKILLTEDSSEENNFAWVQDTFAAAFRRHVVDLPMVAPAFLKLALVMRGRSATDPYRRFSSERLEAFGFQASAPFPARIEKYAAELAGGCARSG